MTLNTTKKPMTAKAKKAARAVLIEQAATMIYHGFTYEYEQGKYRDDIVIMAADKACRRVICDDHGFDSAKFQEQQVLWAYYFDNVSADAWTQSYTYKASYNLLHAEIDTLAAEKIDSFLND